MDPTPLILVFMIVAALMIVLFVMGVARSGQGRGRMPDSIRQGTPRFPTEMFANTAQPEQHAHPHHQHHHHQMDATPPAHHQPHHHMDTTPPVHHTPPPSPPPMHHG